MAETPKGPQTGGQGYGNGYDGIGISYRGSTLPWKGIGIPDPGNGGTFMPNPPYLLHRAPSGNLDLAGEARGESGSDLLQKAYASGEEELPRLIPHQVPRGTNTILYERGTCPIQWDCVTPVSKPVLI